MAELTRFCGQQQSSGKAVALRSAYRTHRGQHEQVPLNHLRITYHAQGSLDVSTLRVQKSFRELPRTPLNRNYANEPSIHIR